MKTPALASFALLLTLATGCSTNAASAADADAGLGGPDDACPSVHPTPAAIEFDCDASLPDAGGCPGSVVFYDQSFSDEHTYAPGCRAFLPVPLSACVGACCGPEVCFCEAHASGPGSAPGFVCPY